MPKDYSMLSELHDLKDSMAQEYFEDARRDAINEWTSSTSDRQASIAQGKKIAIDKILDDIENAWNKVQEERAKRERPSMSKSF